MIAGMNKTSHESPPGLAFIFFCSIVVERTRRIIEFLDIFELCLSKNLLLGVLKNYL